MRRKKLVPIAFVLLMLGSCTVLPGNAQEALPPPVKLPQEWRTWYALWPDQPHEKLNWAFSPDRTYWITNTSGENFLRVPGNIPASAYEVTMRAAIWTSDHSCSNGLQIAIWGEGSPFVKHIRGCDIDPGWNYITIDMSDQLFGRGMGDLEVESFSDTDATWAVAYVYVSGYCRYRFPQIVIGASAR